MWFVLWCILTWAVVALAFIALNPLIGALAVVLAALLTEGLLSAHRAEQAALSNRRTLTK